MIYQGIEEYRNLNNHMDHRRISGIEPSSAIVSKSKIYTFFEM